MKQFYLTEIVTKDKLQLHGLYYEPKEKGKRAILWQHGLSSAFYHERPMLEAFADACEREGIGFAEFNNRGHDLLAGARRMDGTAPYGYSYYSAGAGAEVFEESVLDIEAGIEFLVSRGYSEIIIGGHSTGANKVCYFAGTQKNPHVIGAVLSGPMSDHLHMEKSTDPETLKKNIAYMHELISAGKGDQLLVGYFFFPLTPKRYLSLFEKGSVEDVFDYGDEKPKMEFFSKITLPLLVVFSGADEASDRPIPEIKKVFDAHATAPKYTSVIIPDALHRYNGHEKEAVAAIVDWIKTI